MTVCFVYDSTVLLGLADLNVAAMNAFESQVYFTKIRMCEPALYGRVKLLLYCVCLVSVSN